MKLEKELQEIVDELKINVITSSDQIDDIYDYELLKNSNDLSIRKGKKEQINIIIFDTDVYNSTYVLDLFKEYVDENGELLDHFKLHYCDNLQIYKLLFEKYWRKIGFFGINDEENPNVLHKKELNQIIPIILVINGFEEEILIESETIAPIQSRTLDLLFEELS